MSEVKKNYREKWEQWQQSVIAIVRKELSDVFSKVRLEDFDWEAWRVLYDKGCTPAVAVNEAFSKTRRRN
jgi:hypothetical protein